MKYLLLVVGLTISVTLLILAFGSFIYERSEVIPSSGVIVSIDLGVYWDSSCNSPVTSIDWRELHPNSSKTVTVYIRNEGTTSISLHMTTEKWNPESASNYISLTWNMENVVLQPNVVVAARLTLKVAYTIENIDVFNFQIRFSGSKVE